MTKQINPTLGFVSGTAYCVTIIVGAGILALPGSGLLISGVHSVWAWLFDFCLAIPLLFIFGKMIVRVRSAGGIADFVKVAFGSGAFFKSAQMILLVTLVFGTAAIARVGADYAASVWPIGKMGSLLISVLLIGIPAFLNLVGMHLSATIQKIWAALLVFFLLFVVFSSMPHWGGLINSGMLKIHSENIRPILKTMGLFWFAYTGIEMISFLGEDFKSTKAFGASVVTSFLIVGFIYVGLGMAAASLLDPNVPATRTSPLAAILEVLFGSKVSVATGIFGVALILINLNAAILGASRLVFSVGREAQILPKKIGQISKNGTPTIALMVLTVGAILVQVASVIFDWPTDSILTLVSQNWFLLYVFSIVSFIKLENSYLNKMFGVIGLVVASVFMSVFSYYLIVPLICAGIALIVGRGQKAGI